MNTPPDKKQQIPKKLVLAPMAKRLSFSALPKVVALYGDGFDSVVLNRQAWASYIDYLLSEGIDKLPMYSVHKFMVSKNFQTIRDFILYARGRGIYHIEGIYGSLNQFKTNILAYQNWAPIRSAALDSVNLENEPYRYGCKGSDAVDWSQEDAWRKEVYSICKSNDTSVIRWQMDVTKYHGWNIPSNCGGSQWSASQISDSLVSTTDYLLLHCYTVLPKFSQTLGRLRDLDAACRKAGKKDYEIYIILSTESKTLSNKDGSSCKNEFSGLYMKTRTTKEWYLEFVAQMKAYIQSGGPDFTNILISGVYDFDNWYHKQVRP